MIKINNFNIVYCMNEHNSVFFYGSKDKWFYYDLIKNDKIIFKINNNKAKYYAYYDQEGNIIKTGILEEYD